MDSLESGNLELGNGPSGLSVCSSMRSTGPEISADTSMHQRPPSLEPPHGTANNLGDGPQDPSELWDLGEDILGLDAVNYFDMLENVSMTPNDSALQGLGGTSGHEFQGSHSPNKASRVIPVSVSVVNDLITVYFEKVHGFVPIIHRPRVLAKHLQNHQPSEEQFVGSSLDSALLINSMCSLAARFSNSPAFDGVCPRNRGNRFAALANAIYQEYPHCTTPPTPSLTYLQGCVLLALFELATGPSLRGWVLTGYCIRLAYEMDLNTIDEDFTRNGSTGSVPATQPSSAADWSLREEFRRLWWSIWELDTFTATLSCRPFAIDRRRNHVLLPATDTDWFADNPVASVALGSGAGMAWKALRGLPNANERAWYLVSNYLLGAAHELWLQSPVPPEQKRSMETVLSCFGLALPEEFHLKFGSITFDDDNFHKNNTIIAIALLLKAAQSYTFLTAVEGSSMTPPPDGHPAKDPALPHLNIRVHAGPGPRMTRMDPCSLGVSRIIRSWSPEYVPFLCPLVTCTLLGPNGVHAGAKPASNSSERNDDLDREMLKLTLAHVARYWSLGTILLGMSASLLPDMSFFDCMSIILLPDMPAFLWTA